MLSGDDKLTIERGKEKEYGERMSGNKVVSLFIMMAIEVKGSIEKLS